MPPPIRRAEPPAMELRPQRHSQFGAWEREKKAGRVPMKYLTLSLLVALSTVGGVYAEDLIQMRFPQLRVQEIIEYYRHLTGAHVITDSQVTGLMSLETLEPVSRAKAIELIETALFANGFSIIQPQPDTIQIIGLGRSA